MMDRRSLPEWAQQAAALLLEAVIVAASILFTPAKRIIRRESPIQYKQRHMPMWVRIITIISSLAVIFITSIVFIPAALQRGPKQPIPFSHHLHVTNKHLNCIFCHNTVRISKKAGMPPVRKCLLCHNVVAAKFRPIQKIHRSFNTNKPVEWVRVYRLPDFVQFNHQAHIAKGFDCSQCHGDVAHMDRIYAEYQLNMRFCVDCHWRNKGPDNCFTCHY